MNIYYRMILSKKGQAYWPYCPLHVKVTATLAGLLWFSAIPLGIGLIFDGFLWFWPTIVLWAIGCIGYMIVAVHFKMTHK